jgi:hypothetical protein
MQEMVWSLIALVDRRIVHIEHFNPVFLFLQLGNVRIVKEQGVGGRAHVGLKLAWIGAMQIANRGRQDDHITRTLK